MDCYTGKRKREEDDEAKRAKQVSERAAIEGQDWPVYNHPEGGVVKITPWGSLRQFVNDKGETVTKFEDKEFHDLRFEPQDYYPQTPQSLYPATNPLPVPQAKTFGLFDLSPSNEVEGYVMDGYNRGYNGLTPPPQQQFEREHEHYFGMGDEDVTM